MYAMARRKAFDTASARLAAFGRRRVPPPYAKGEAAKICIIRPGARTPPSGRGGAW